MTDHNEVLKIEQLARHLIVPKSTLYRLAAEGDIPSRKVGRHRRFRRKSIDGWLDKPGEQVRDGGRSGR